MAENSYDSRRLVYVTPFTGTTLKYGFLTNCPAAVSTACGHTAVEADYPTGLIIGANAPKPGRASKRTATGVNGSFYDIAQRAALRTAGYSLTAPRIRRAGNTANSRAVYITTGGVKYAWRMPDSQYTKVSADLGALGILDATGADVDLVWGASYPKPPTASKTVISGDNVNVISTFVDPDSVDSLPAGWTPPSGEKFYGTAV